MNKEKFSEILDQYSEYLKKYGIYLLIILFFLTFSLNYLLGQVKYAGVEINSDSLPAADVAVEKADPKAEEEMLTAEDNTDAVRETQVVPVAKSIEVPAVKSEQESEKEINPTINTERPLNLQWPVQGQVLKNYGLSYSKIYADYRLHPGIDIETKPGMNITAAYGGKVTLVENSNETKFIVEIDHGQGRFTYYAHLAQALVKEGQTIKIGDKIGQAGAPGTDEAEEGSHLHFCVKQDGHWVDPIEYLEK